jgi:hypothetical protein
MVATNDELLAELGKVREAINESNRLLATKASRRSLHFTVASVALSIAVGLGGASWAWWERRELCRSQNANQDVIRDVGVDLSVGDANAIIEVAGDDVPPEVAQQLRDIQRQNAEEIVAQLKDREC